MRIAGITIPDNKTIAVSLTYMYGIGRTTAQKVLLQAKVDPAKAAGKLSSEEVGRIKDVVEKSFRTEGELRRDRGQNVKRLIEIKAYRGVRHMRHLPVRGQRTKTNNRTVKGNKRTTVGSGKRKVELK
jgi:small subunit ribosomal protein S13